MKQLIFSFILVGVASATAFAQDAPPPQGPPGGGGRQFQMPTFAELDKNKDKKLSRDELPGRMAQAFDRLDTNHDGFIDEEEWAAMQRNFGGRGPGGGGPGGGNFVRTGDALTKFLDANTDGKVSRDEFAKLVTLFDALDKDHNGELSPDELNSFMRTVNDVQTQATGGVEVQSLFEKFDKNKDGKITAEEMGNDKTFKALDLNKDGEITRSEADTALKQLKKASDSKKAPAEKPNN